MRNASLPAALVALWLAAPVAAQSSASATDDLLHRERVGRCATSVVQAGAAATRETALSFCECTIGQKERVLRQLAEMEPDVVGRPPQDWPPAAAERLGRIVERRGREVLQECGAATHVNVERLLPKN